MTGPLLDLHASAVEVDRVGVLIRGASGSGKSSLVLALLMADRAANRLIADDRVEIRAEGGRLMASVPAPIAGLLEIRGQGIMRVPHRSPAPIELVVDLEPPEVCQRMPQDEDRTVVLAGIVVRRVVLPVGQADGWIRIRAAIAFGAD